MVNSVQALALKSKKECLVMSANKFKISGNPARVDSLDDFFTQEVNGVFENILYFPDEFKSASLKVLKQKGKTYKNVSFKDTTFNSVSFVDCTFEGCLLLSSKFIDCEFVGCLFIDTNTIKSHFDRTLIDPENFKKNFDLKQDANIAIDLYHSLYKNLSNERQPERTKQSLYMMHRAENAQLNYNLKEKKISFWTFIWKKTVHLFDFLTSGYGLKLYRVFLTFLFIVLFFSSVNYIWRYEFFDFDSMVTFTDSIYFTVVTLTTLGYGDISPSTQLGKCIISIEVAIGIIVISLFLTSISSRITRS